MTYSEKKKKNSLAPGYSAAHVLQATNGNTLNIATELLGTTNRHMLDKTALRFGTKGSLVVNVSGPLEGLWKDFETGKKGNLIQLVQREKNLTFKDAVTTLGDQLIGKPELPIYNPRDPKPSLDLDPQERVSHLKSVKEIHLKSRFIDGTLAETYLHKELGENSAVLSPDLRYLPKGSPFTYKGEQRITQHPILAAFGRNAEGELHSVQLTKLTEKASRVLSHEGEKFPKVQYGNTKNSFVTIQEENVRVFIVEGVETALSIKEANVTGKTWQAWEFTIW